MADLLAVGVLTPGRARPRISGNYVKMRPVAGPVLLCFDGSEGARTAIRRAGRLLPGRPAVCLCVWEAAGTPRSALETYLEVLGTSAEEYNRLAAAGAQRTADEGARLASEAGFDAVALEVPVDDGAAEAILRVAEERDAEVIVMGVHGRSRLGRRVLGGVANAVVHATARPVLMIRQ